MRPQPDVIDLVANLKARGEPFALATVVRTVSVTAAKAGAKAVIRPDGTVSEGWIGGGCARAAVLSAAREADRRRALPPRLAAAQGPLHRARTAAGRGARGRALRPQHVPEPGNHGHLRRADAARAFAGDLRRQPGGGGAGRDRAALRLPRHRLRPARGPAAVRGGRPAHRGLCPAGDRGRASLPHRLDTGACGDEAALTAALSAEADHVAFVGSRRKVAALREKILANGLPAERFDRLKGPAGLDLGAVTPEEIALSILAEILAVRRQGRQFAANH